MKLKGYAAAGLLATLVIACCCTANAQTLADYLPADWEEEVPEGLHALFIERVTQYGSLEPPGELLRRWGREEAAAKLKQFLNDPAWRSFYPMLFELLIATETPDLEQWLISWVQQTQAWYEWQGLRPLLKPERRRSLPRLEQAMREKALARVRHLREKAQLEELEDRELHAARGVLWTLGPATEDATPVSEAAAPAASGSEDTEDAGNVISGRMVREHTGEGVSGIVTLGQRRQETLDGSFRFEGVAPGEHALGYAPDDPLLRAETDQLLVTVQADAPIEDVELEAIPAAVLKGSVVDQKGRPVKRCEIGFSGPGFAGALLKTDVRGVFRREHLPPGSYSLRADGAGSRIVRLQGGEETEVALVTTQAPPPKPTLEEKPATTVAGVVLNPFGQPLAGIRIGWRGSDYDIATETDAEGEYTLPLRGSGEFTAAVRRLRYVTEPPRRLSVSHEYEVLEGGTLTLGAGPLPPQRTVVKQKPFLPLVLHITAADDTPPFLGFTLLTPESQEASFSGGEGWWVRMMQPEELPCVLEITKQGYKPAVLPLEKGWKPADPVKIELAPGPFRDDEAVLAAIGVHSPVVYGADLQARAPYYRMIAAGEAQSVQRAQYIVQYREEHPPAPPEKPEEPKPPLLAVRVLMPDGTPVQRLHLVSMSAFSSPLLLGEPGKIRLMTSKDGVYRVRPEGRGVDVEGMALAPLMKAFERDEDGNIISGKKEPETLRLEPAARIVLTVQDHSSKPADNVVIRPAERAYSNQPLTAPLPQYSYTFGEGSSGPPRPDKEGRLRFERLASGTYRFVVLQPREEPERGAGSRPLPFPPLMMVKLAPGETAHVAVQVGDPEKGSADDIFLSWYAERDRRHAPPLETRDLERLVRLEEMAAAELRKMPAMESLPAPKSFLEQRWRQEQRQWEAPRVYALLDMIRALHLEHAAVPLQAIFEHWNMDYHHADEEVKEMAAAIADLRDDAAVDFFAAAGLKKALAPEKRSAALLALGRIDSEKSLARLLKILRDYAASKGITLDATLTDQQQMQLTSDMALWAIPNNQAPMLLPPKRQTGEVRYIPGGAVFSYNMDGNNIFEVRMRQFRGVWMPVDAKHVAHVDFM